MVGIQDGKDGPGPVGTFFGGFLGFAVLVVKNIFHQLDMVTRVLLSNKMGLLDFQITFEIFVH
jgi:hypothetical protein